MHNRKRRFRPRYFVAACSSALLGATFAAFFLVASPVLAEHTRFWRQSDYSDFEPGVAHGVALRSDGKLVLAPKVASFLVVGNVIPADPELVCA